MGLSITSGEARVSALRSLGVRRLVLVVHDSCFPSTPEEDIGRGSPYSAGALEFLRWARSLGFDGVQLGPQGQTSRGNSSPYDSAIFRRNFLSISLGALADPAARAALAQIVAQRPPGTHVHYLHAYDAQEAALRALCGDREPFEVFCERVAEDQHRTFQRAARELGLKLFGDLHIGFSPEEARELEHLLLPGYLMGAPPSRTNPDGQPWNFPVLFPVIDPAHREAVKQVMGGRLDRLFGDFDGVRIDHPHGWVDPWVYRSDDPDRLHAVQHGARLCSSPDLADHPALARYAIAEPAQLDRRLARHADAWVGSLRDDQVERYGTLFSVAIDRAAAHGRDPADIICEVLSTWPYPLCAVMTRHALGRFCVTQKANLDDPSDVYRSENARPADWIMVGNHDTRPIWRVAETWAATPQLERRARYVSERLATDIPAEPHSVVNAMFADLFASPAENVQIFFADLLGMNDVYNVPGTVAHENWTLRVPNDYVRVHAERAARGAALDLDRALELALRARGLS